MSVRVHRVIQREDPYQASRRDDQVVAETIRRDPRAQGYFRRRGVLRADGTTPFGESYLYRDSGPSKRSPDWESGEGAPGPISVAAHRGTKSQQQDRALAARFRVGGQPAAALVVADGMSSSGPLAAPAAARAVKTFMKRLRKKLSRMPRHEAKRHARVERAMSEAANAANFEMIRKVLLDLPKTPLNQTGVRTVAKALDEIDTDELSANATIAAAVAVDNDLYTLTSGDAVVMIYRPSEPAGSRVLHLTERDQTVVDLFKEGGDAYKDYRRTWQNEVSECLGESLDPKVKLRRYPNLLRPGDLIIVCSDGLGMDRAQLERTIERAESREHAAALVKAQLAGLSPDEYQDNITVAVLEVLERKEARGDLPQAWQVTKPRRVRSK